MIEATNVRYYRTLDPEQAGSEILVSISFELNDGAQEPTRANIDLAFHEDAVPEGLDDPDAVWKLTLERVN